MQDIALLTKYLGGRKNIGSPKSEQDFLPIIREGFPFASFKSLASHLQLNEDMICTSLRIPKRTFARRKKINSPFRQNVSELLFRLARVTVEAKQVLGTDEKARGWLTTENRALGGEKPINLLDTGIGFENVMNVLSHIEHGVYS